ncbi:MAG: PKD domain-containing protein [Patescibacteria group bacterium]|nr:PKD domain-containing protein [Patescibacteria group bacterium]
MFSDTGKKFQTKKIHYGFYRLTTEERQDYFYLLVRDKNTEQTDLLKIFYQVPDIEPSVCFSVASDEGVSPFVVAFDALCSEDRDGKILSYRWDFGDGKKEVVEEAKIYHTYYYSSDADVTPYDTDFIARYNPILEIQDSEGNWFVSYDSVDLQVHKSSGVPKVFLNVPYAYDFIVGEELTVSLLASDIEEGYLRTGFSWYLQSQDKKIRYDIDQCRDYKKCTFTIPGAEVLQDYTDMLLYAQAQDTDGNIGISTPYPFVIHY